MTTNIAVVLSSPFPITCHAKDHVEAYSSKTTFYPHSLVLAVATLLTRSSQTQMEPDQIIIRDNLEKYTSRFENPLENPFCG